MNHSDMDIKAAECLKGFCREPDDWSIDNSIWFWVHPRDGVLIGEAYSVSRNKYGHQFKRFKPSENIEQAMLLDKDYLWKSIESVNGMTTTCDWINGKDWSSVYRREVSVRWSDLTSKASAYAYARTACFLKAHGIEVDK